MTLKDRSNMPRHPSCVFRQPSCMLLPFDFHSFCLQLRTRCGNILPFYLTDEKHQICILYQKTFINKNCVEELCKNHLKINYV